MIKKIFIFTGAGISAESGVPTFRDKNGLWANYDIDKVCNYDTWKQNFELMHEFYNKRRAELPTVSPNAAHLACKEWQNRYGATIFTQNIDDLFERAGCSGVIHLHGFLQDMICEACGKIWNIGYQEWKPDQDGCPSCPSKRGVKPNVVFFNQPAPLYRQLGNQIYNLDHNDVTIVIGTSGYVVPIADQLRGWRGTKILNNLEEGPWMDASVFDHVFYMKASEAVKEIDKVLETLSKG